MSKSKNPKTRLSSIQKSAAVKVETLRRTQVWGLRVVPAYLLAKNNALVLQFALFIHPDTSGAAPTSASQYNKLASDILTYGVGFSGLSLFSTFFQEGSDRSVNLESLSLRHRNQKLLCSGTQQTKSPRPTKIRHHNKSAKKNHSSRTPTGR
jgi:hypothetical protein